MSVEISNPQAMQFVSEITAALNSGDNPHDVLDQILAACIELTAADSGSIMLLNTAKTHLEIIASRGLTAGTGSMHISINDGVTGWVARSIKPRIVNDADTEQDYIRLGEGLSSELAVPMAVKGEVIGVISVDSREKNAFVDSHLEFLSVMANLAAGIFINLNDNHILRLKNRFHTVLHEISRVLSRSVRLKDIFLEIMNITERAFRLYRSTLLIYDKNSDLLRIVAGAGEDAEENAGITYSPGEGITGSVFLNKKAVFIPSVADEPTFLNRMKTYSRSGEDMGFYCCPIFSGSEVVGVFSTFTRREDGLHSESLMEFLEILGSIISQAITIQKLIRDEKRIIELENQFLKQELSGKYKFGNIIGRSAPMLKLFEKVRLVADSRSSVLLTGESGTGKELIVSAIHYNSPRKDGAFIKINCAAIPENLMESELFGHKKGSFTGAVSDKKGKFEQADGGTIFLDEIGEMDFNLQSKLLRVLQEREIEPIGGRTKQVDVRVIAATNADLEELIKEKKFRSDLYYRLNVINLRIPPLRERKEDIHLLAKHFIEKYNKENGKSIKGISPEAIRLLEGYEWPGNVRQLENVIERGVVMSRNEVLDEDDFQDDLKAADPIRPEFSADRSEIVPFSAEQTFIDDRLSGLEGRAYDVVISEVEKKLILAVLRKFRYTKIQSAKFLGINRNTLDKKIRDLNIEY